MSLSILRAQSHRASCIGRPAACRRIGVHEAKPRVRGRLAVEGSRGTRVSAMRISWRAVASRLPDTAESWPDTTRRTTMRGAPQKLLYPA